MRVIFALAIGFAIGFAYERHDRLQKLIRGLDRIAGVVRQQEQEERRCACRRN